MVKIESTPLEIPQAPASFIEDNDRFYYQRLEHATPEKRRNLIEEMNLLFENDQCGYVNPLFSRICRCCKLAFKNAGHLLKHTGTYEHEVKRCESLGLPPPKNPLRCDICDKNFASPQNLANHLKTSLHADIVNAPSFCCELCQKTYKNRRQLWKLQKYSKIHKEKEEIRARSLQATGTV